MTCFGFESTGCGPVLTLEGQWEQMSLRGLGPWEVELAPFPFAGASLEVEVESVHVAADRFRSDYELRAQVSSGRREPRRTVYAARS